MLPLALVAAQVLFLTPYRAVAWWMWAIFVVAWIVPAGKVCALSRTVATSAEPFLEESVCIHWSLLLPGLATLQALMGV